MKNIPCTGVILAGGLNSRFSGANKAFLTIGDQCILDRIYGVYKDLFDEIIIVSNDPLKYLEWDALIVSDIYQCRSSLTGIHAGLFHTGNPYAFIMACDTPFLKKELALHLLEKINGGYDAVIPETHAGLEPLCAVYSVKMVEPMAQQLEREQLKIRMLFKKRRVCMVSEKKLREQDPDLLSFYNVNTPDDLEKARRMIPV